MLITVEIFLGDNAAPIAKLRVDVVHEQVKELAGEGGEERTSELHLDMVVYEAAVAWITIRVDIDAPL